MRAEGCSLPYPQGVNGLHPGSYAGMTRIRFEGFVTRHLRPSGHPPGTCCTGSKRQYSTRNGAEMFGWRGVETYELANIDDYQRLVKRGSAGTASGQSL